MAQETGETSIVVDPKEVTSADVDAAAKAAAKALKRREARIKRREDPVKLERERASRKAYRERLRELAKMGKAYKKTLLKEGEMKETATAVAAEAQ